MTKSPSNSRHLLAWARKLQLVTSYGELLECSVEEMRRATRYRVAWLALYSDDEATVTVLSGTGAASRENLEQVNMVEFSAADDPMIALIASSTEPVVVDDAPTDPRPRQDYVAVMKNRTIINVPLTADERHMGSLGTGTFGDEGPLPPTPEELDYLVAMASHITVVLGRLRVEEQRATLQEQLRRAQRLDAMGRVAGGVAHDFNNLLSVVIGNVEVAKLEAGLSPMMVECLEEIDAAATRAAVLSRQLLAFSKHQVVKPQTTNLNDLLSTIVPMLERVIPERITLEFLPGQNLGNVLVDPGQLEQVIFNLTLNARDAVNDVGRIVIETENVLIDETYRHANPWAKLGRFVLLSVTDTGQGMSDEVRSQIFEPFFTTKGPERGTGLGLSVVFGIVQQHDGTVNAYSEEGTGTTLKVYLPIIDRPASTVGTKIEPTIEGGTEHILVAEDDERVRRLIRSMLRQAGYRVSIAENGAQALEIFDKADPCVDLVVTDVVMPLMGGAALQEALMSRIDDIPIVMMSGYSPSGFMSAVRDTGRVVVLTKPFRSRQLLHGIRTLLDADGD